MRRLYWLVRRGAFKRGVAGSSTLWLGVWTVLVVTDFFRRRGASKADVHRFTLRQGESVVIRDLGVPS